MTADQILSLKTTTNGTFSGFIAPSTRAIRITLKIYDVAARKFLFFEPVRLTLDTRYTDLPLNSLLNILPMELHSCSLPICTCSEQT